MNAISRFLYQKPIVYPLIWGLLLFYFLKPNLNFWNPLIARMMELVILVGVISFFLMKRKIDGLQYVRVFWLYIFFTLIPSVIRAPFLETVYIDDGFELTRPFLFFILPCLIGYNYVRGDIDRLMFFFNIVLAIGVFHILISLFQILNIGGELFFFLYSQEGLTQGRGTGICLFIQEAGIVTILTSVVLCVYEELKKRKRVGNLASAFVVLTVSKTVFLSLAIYLFLCFLVKAKFPTRIRRTFFTKIILVVCLIACVPVLIALFSQPQFIASIIEGFGNFTEMNESDISIGNRVNYLNDLKKHFENDNIMELLFGFKPIFSQRGYRYEMTFFNVLAKFGIIGVVLFNMCYNFLLFYRLPAYSNVAVRKLRFFLIAVSLTFTITSVTGATLEGTKSTFLYFLLAGALLSFRKGSPNACITFK